MWRLANFDLERRPSPEDVYLYAGVAKDNPSDRRLFALAEVRDLARRRRPGHRREHYPRLERTGLLALAAMRAELARYSPRERPLANRLVLDVTRTVHDAAPARQRRGEPDPLARRGSG